MESAIIKKNPRNPRLVILGSGESGTGAALLGQHLGYDVLVSDKGNIKPEYKTALNNAGIPWEEGQHTLENILNADEIIKSPGIPEKTEVMKAIRAAGINVIGEIEWGYRHAGPCRIVAITGSNGKTTTTMLTDHLLRTAGLNVRMGGNVGNSFAAMVLDDLLQGQNNNPERIFVLEVSSFQLDDIQQFKPEVAVLLNITPDHLDRYEYKLENYARAKFRIAMNQGQGDVFIYNGIDPITAEIMPAVSISSQVQHVAIGQAQLETPGIIHLGEQHFTLTKGNLRGPHNQFNAACAAQTALQMGAEPAKIQEGLDTFQTPPHRLEKVAEHNGVTWINDSKATNVDSVFYALQAMNTPTIWIAGGTDKGNDYSPLLDLVANKVKAIVCMGVDNSKLLSVFGPMNKPIVEARSAREAVEAAAKFAQAGDTVLLSPACASFDLFKNYEDRGAQFREEVLRVVSG